MKDEIRLNFVYTNKFLARFRVICWLEDLHYGVVAFKGDGIGK